MICSAPWPMVPKVPSVVGTLPTSTKPARKTPSAVLRQGRLLVKKVTALPTGEGGEGGGASGPCGVSCTMVVPSPCELALLLKLLTRTSPALIVAPPGKPLGTKATP